MKTLAVLSALAAVAFAAPAIEGNTDSTYMTPTDYRIPNLREKKSTELDTTKEKLLENFEDHQASEQTSNKFGPSGIVARTFSGFKKPIIVKKKIGYQLYRDSEEEQSQADPRESCRKQIKVKLCDDNNSMDKMKSASIDHTHEEISEKEMKHSINMAKEAVETFQRDLEKMEHHPTDNNNQRHTTLGSDTELREDIEKARQALEHIQRKFKNIDLVMPIQDENIPNTNLDMTQMEEAKMAQWKDASNHHKSVEISKNLEDNFKFAKENDVSKSTTSIQAIHMNEEDKHKPITHTTIEDIDTRTSSDIENTKAEDGITSIIEDKETKMDIQSDNLIKDVSPNENTEQKPAATEQSAREPSKMIEENISAVSASQNLELKNNADTNDLENKKNQHTTQGGLDKDTDMHEKSVKNQLGKNSEVKTSDDPLISNDNSPSKMEEEVQKDHLRSIKDNDQVIHESKHVDTELNNHNEKDLHSEGANEGVTMHHDQNQRQGSNVQDNINHKSSLLQKSSTESKSVNQGHLLNNDDEKNIEKKNELLMAAHQRASTNFHKELLNNMDFVEHKHQVAHHKPTFTESTHMLKNEMQELHERFTVPEVHPNAEHLKTMMKFSDNSDHDTAQRHQLKMATMFNNEQPNFNVQFNSPQEFEQQTNVQGIMPFRAAGNLHEKHLHESGVEDKFDNMHSEDIPTDLHDPLKVRWNQERELTSGKLKSASQFHDGHMQMEGSSQHFNIQNTMPLRGAPINAQQLNLNEQLRAHQRWGQEQQLHGHEHFISRNNEHMHEKTMQPSSLIQMRGAPKMALEYASPNQWTHNHGAYRSSYGPAMSTSYGSGSSSGGGSAVGVFPNANVGNCAVPLLLSCSPSVVSGSLAKANTYSAPSYSSPSYRSEDMNFHRKRGIDIDEVNTGLKLQKLVMQSQKSNTITEKKL